jgi:predicted flap endonuclease-1-like 5' DNA nuclease
MTESPSWLTSLRIVAAACALLVIALGVFAALYPTAFDLRGAVLSAGLAFVLLAVGVLYAVVAPRATTTTAPAAAPSSMSTRPRLVSPAPAPRVERTEARAEPFGDVHPVIDVEGIGPTIAAKLKKQGIDDTRQLWRADAKTVAAGLGLAPPIVRDWQAMAELMAVSGIGKQYAEVLVKAGYTTIAQVRRADADEVAKAVAEAGEDLTRRIQKNSVTPKVAEGWIEAARTHAA